MVNYDVIILYSCILLYVSIIIYVSFIVVELTNSVHIENMITNICGCFSTRFKRKSLTQDINQGPYRSSSFSSEKITPIYESLLCKAKDLIISTMNYKYIKVLGLLSPAILTPVVAGYLLDNINMGIGTTIGVVCTSVIIGLFSIFSTIDLID